MTQPDHRSIEARWYTRATFLRIAALGATAIVGVPLLATCGQGGTSAPATSPAPAAPSAASAAQGGQPAATTASAAATSARDTVTGTAATSVQSAGSASAAGKGQQTLSLWDRMEPTYNKFFTAWLPGFRAAHPNLNVEYVAFGEGNWEKLVAAMAGGTPPDVVITNSWRPRYFAKQKQAIVLDPYIKTSQLDAQDFLQGIYKAMSVDGKQYAIPQYVNTNLMYYNRDLFKKMGLPSPTDDWTQDQFVDAAGHLTNGALPVRQVWGMSVNPTGVTVRACSLLWGRGAQYNDPDNPDVFTWGLPQNVTALQWLYDLTWKDRDNAATNDDRGGEAEDVAFFQSGKTAMFLEGAHQLLTWKDKAKVDWDVAALPVGPSGRGERGAVDGYIIPVGVKTPDSSWVVLEGITSKEANRLRSDLAGLPPARKSQLEGWASSIPNKNIKSGIPTDAVRPDPAALWPRAADISGPLGDIWTKLYIKRQYGVQDALKQANDVVTGILGASAAKS
mgnify:CR=1 FL=1